MSDPVAIAYPDEQAARRARNNLAAGVEKGLVEVEDVVVIASDEDGRVFPLLGAWERGFGSTEGALVGGMIGLVLLGPLLAMAAGAAGALAGRAGVKAADKGVPDEFVTEIWESLGAGSAAMIILVHEGWAPQAVLPHLHEPGRVISATLDDELAAQLDAALAGGVQHPR